MIIKHYVRDEDGNVIWSGKYLKVQKKNGEFTTLAKLNGTSFTEEFNKYFNSKRKGK